MMRHRGEREPPAHDMLPIERTIALVLTAGLALSIALMAVGLVLCVVRGASLPRHAMPLTDLPHGLVSLSPVAYLSLGLIALIATPFARVVGSLIDFALEHDRRYVAVTATVLAVMCLSILLGRA